MERPFIKKRIYFFFGIYFAWIPNPDGLTIIFIPSKVSASTGMQQGLLKEHPNGIFNWGTIR
jgi:hypothetical protein